MLDSVTLTARTVDAQRFVFIPETWESQLKPYSRAQWKHESNAKINKSLPPDNYEITAGDFLAFPGMDRGGFYAAHLYAVVKEMRGTCGQVHASITPEGLTLETIGGDIKTRVTLKPRGMSRKDTPHSVVMKY